MKRHMLARYLLLAGALIVLAVGLCQAEGHAIEGKAGSYTVIATFDKGRPVEGTNRMEIAITDAASRPLAHGLVQIEYFMPSLPGRPPMMDHTATAGPSGDRYEAKLNLAMKGEWKVILSITGPKGTDRMTFGFEVK